MRGGKPLAALGLLIASLLPLQPLFASALFTPSREGAPDVVRRWHVRDLIPALHQLTQGTPVQTLIPPGTQGTVIDPGHLEEPVKLERNLRNALRNRGDSVRLTVTNGTAHMGSTTISANDRVNGHLVVLEGNADIYGRVNGNVVALDGDIIMHQGATITGDALAIGGRVHREEGQIGGAVTESAASPDSLIIQATNISAEVAQRGAGLLGLLLTLVVLGFAIVTFARPNLEIVSDTVAHSLGRSFMAGLVGELLVLPSLGLIVIGLVFTILGTVLIPFALVVFALLIIVALVGGLLAVAFNIGETITRRRMAKGMRISPNGYRYVLTGLGTLGTIWLVWVVFGWVPVAGLLMLAVATLSTWLVGTIGFGAALLSRGGAREYFAGRLIPPIMVTDEHLWATPRLGVPAARRPPREIE